jgi:hypothetical protein
MPVFRFSSPSGRTYRVTGPEGSTPEQAWDILKDHVASGIDTSKSVPEVRQQIDGLEEPFRERALKRWADDYVAKERQAGGAEGIGNAISNTMRTVSRGTFVGPFLDELTAATSAVPYALTGGAIGAPYDETLAYQRAQDRAIDDAYPVLSTAAKVAGGVAGGLGALKAGSTALQQGAGLLVGGPIGAFSPSLSVGGTARNFAAGTGFAGTAIAGNAEGREGQDVFEAGQERLQEAAQGAPIGGVFGAFAPVAISGIGTGVQKAGEVLSPQLARLSATVKPALQRAGVVATEQPPRSMGAAAAPRPVAPTPAEAAADQVIANHLMRAGVTTTDLRQRLAQAGDNATMGENSRAQQMLAPVDLDESLQRLAAAAGRQHTAAANPGKEFLQARQTGLTPPGSAAPDLAARTGLPTRAELGAPVTGKQAVETLGSRFGTRPDEAVPMGQAERVLDALKRALRIVDSKWHGHGKTGYQTFKQLLAQARAEAKESYDAVRKASEGVDIAPAIQPVIDDLIAQIASGETGRTTATLLRRIVREFTDETGKARTSWTAFDEAKQAVDAMVDIAIRAGDRNVARVLGDPLRRLIAAVDEVAVNGLGKKYAAAREQFAGNAAMRDALELGAKSLKDDSEVVADMFAELATEGERKLARLGFYTAAQDMIRRKERTADITRIFNNPRVQEILRVLIPRSKDGGAAFANRPERFGGLLGAERSMIATRDIMRGGSPTARNLADDEAYEGISQISSTIEEFARSPGFVAMGMRYAQMLLDRLFGMRPDTAEALARRLFTADPAARQQIILALEERMGPSRSAQFARLMVEYRRSLTAGPTMATGATPQE